MSTRPRRFQAGGSNPASVGASTLPSTWQQYIQQPGLQQQNPGLYAALQERLNNPQLGANASAFGPWARPFLGTGPSAGASAPGATGSGSQQQNPAQAAAQQTAQLSDQELALQKADRLRATAAALTTGPTPVGASAAQAAQNALAGKTGTTQSSLTGGFARGGKVKRYQTGGKAEEGEDDTGPMDSEERAEHLSPEQRRAAGPPPGYSRTWDTDSQEYLPGVVAYLPQQREEYQNFLKDNEPFFRSMYEHSKSLEAQSGRSPAGILWKDLPPEAQAKRPPFPSYENFIPPIEGYMNNPRMRNAPDLIHRPQAPLLRARGGRVRRFQAGGANDGTQTTLPMSQRRDAGAGTRTTTPAAGGSSQPGDGTQTGGTTTAPSSTSAPTDPTGGAYFSWSPVQQQAWANGASAAQVAAMAPTAAAAAPAAAGTNYQYNPYVSPDQNPAPPAGYVAVPFGAGTSVVPSGDLAYQNFLALQNSPFMTPAAIQNQAIMGNAGLPGSLQGNATVPVGNQQVPWSSMTPAQQYMYMYLQGTGQSIPSNFMGQYQGPSAAWNDPSLNTLGVPQGQSIVNGALVNTPSSTTSPGGIGTSPGTFTSNATGAGVGTGSGATGTTTAATATPAVAQTPTGSAGKGAGLGFRKGGKMPRQRPRRFQIGGFNAAPAGGGNWQQALQQMIAQQQQPGAQGMGAAAGAMNPSPGAAAMGAMAGASPGMGQPQPTFGAAPGVPAAGMGAMAGAMPGSPGAAAMGALAGASPGAQGGGQNIMQLLQALQAQRGAQPQAAAPGAGAGPGSSYGASATPNQQWGQMLLGSAPGTGLMNQGQANPMGQQALWRNYLGQLQGGLGMTGQGMAQGGSVPPPPDEHGDVGSHYRVPLRGGEHEHSSHPDTQWGLIADGEKRAYQTGGTVDESPKTHATGVPMSRRKATGGVSDPLPERHASGVPYRKATGGGVDTAPTHHASGVPIKGSPKGGQPLGTVSKFNSTKGAPGNLATTAAGRGRGFAKGGVTGSKGTMDSTKPAPGNLATSQAGHDRFAEGGVLAFAAGGPHEAVKPKTSRTVLRRRPAAMPHSPRRRPVPTPPFRDQDNEDAMGPPPTPTAASAPAPAPAPAAPPPAPPPFAKGGAVCASCGKAHGGACKGMARGGKFAGSKQRMIRKAGGGKWIQSAIKKPGALRAQLGAKSGEPIPAGKLAKAAKAPGKLGQRARLAQTLKGFKHARGGVAACPDCGKQHSGSCKMAAGGVAKVRRGFPNTIKAPKRLARGGTVRGGGAAQKGLKFSGVF